VSIKKVIIFGKIPPPIGGVTVSVNNLIKSLLCKGLLVDILSWRCLFSRYDMAHIHYSSLVKRAIGVIAARLFSNKVIFTVHGKYLDTSNIFNRFSIFLSDGVVLLNNDLYKDVSKSVELSKLTVLPSLFAEGFTIDDDGFSYFEKVEGKKNLLLYAYDRSYRGNEETYGVEFIINNLHQLPDEFNVILLDISGQYKDLASANTGRVTYINKVVNFIGLLKQVDIYIRPTCMDGASVAVQEAQLLGVPVIASNVVDRPVGVTTYVYKDFPDFVRKLSEIESSEFKPDLLSVDHYIDYCLKL